MIIEACKTIMWIGTSVTAIILLIDMAALVTVGVKYLIDKMKED